MPRKMIKTLFLLSFAVFLTAPQSFADISLSVIPNTQEVILGDTAYVDIILSGLEEDPGLDEYYLYIEGIDTSVINFNLTESNFGVGDTAGDPNFMQQGGSQNLQIEVIEMPETDNLFPEITLATIAFDTVGLGSSDLPLYSFQFVKDGFDGLTIDTYNPGSVNVVPIPGAIWLFFTGGLSLIISRKRGKN
jgi:hypothetical protein